jgi:hypothetical protein
MARGGRSEDGDDFAFLREAVGSLFTSRLLLPLLLAALLTPGASLLALSHLPTAENPDHVPYLGVWASMGLALSVLSIAILRILNRSLRPAWSPDWSILAFSLIGLCTVAVGIAADWFIHPSTFLSALANRFISSVIVVPLGPWMVAIAVERPIAWRPAPWFRRARAWLPALLLWNFLLLAPADALYRTAFVAWVEAGRSGNWWFFVFDGAATAPRIFLALALFSVAYRRVARV